MKRGNIKKLKLIQLKETRKMRKIQWLKQHKKCAILKQKINFKDAALDHKHKLKAQKAGPKGRGLCRGVLHLQANSLEGVITKKFKRYGLHKFITLEEFLINMAAYIQKPRMKQIYIHPDEKPPTKYLMKSEYNLIEKWYFIMFPQRKKPLPPFKKKKNGKSDIRLGIFWNNLLEKANFHKEAKKRKK